MRNQTPLVPSQPAFDVTVYIVLNDFGPLGHAYCVLSRASTERRSIGVATQEFLVRVLGADVTNG